MEPMRQVAPRARVLLTYSGSALLALLALLILSGHAAALGESVEVYPAHVMAGQGFHANLTVPGVSEPAAVQVKVSCASCGPGWTSPVLTNWKPSGPGQWRRAVDFPGPLFGGSQGEPRWGQNYTVTIVGTAATANATVHVIDDWQQPGGIYEVTQSVGFRIAGVPTGQSAYVNISKWNRNGALVPASATLRIAGVNGAAEYAWPIPKEQASDMTCPATGKCRDYTATITANGRTERVQFQVVPARLEAGIVYLLGEDGLDDPLGPLGPSTLAFNRTENVTIHVDLKYHNRARVTDQDRTLAGNLSLNGTLKLAIERITVAQGPDGNQTQALLQREGVLYATYGPKGWRATWNIPRNATVSGAGDNPQYRIRLLAQEDKWGNDVPDLNGTGFRVDVLRIAPKLIGVPNLVVERLTNATAVYNIRFADQSPWSNLTNASAMRASLIDEEGDDLEDVALRYVGGGTWSVSFQPGLRFRPLGFYKLRIHENEDKDGNLLLQTDTEFFEIVAARPRVDLVTRVGHEPRNETQGFARGDFIGIVATIKYADGSAYNLSRLPEGEQYIPLNITKVDGRGEALGHELLALEAMDDFGRWGAEYKIEDLDHDNPLGPWEWRITVQDGERDPNRNDTTFVRPVQGAPIRVAMVRPPEPFVRAGEPVTIRFQARYPAPNNSLVSEAFAGTGLGIEVRTFADGQARDLVARVHPVWVAERGEWVGAWHTNRTTLVGQYAFVLHGQDYFGNVLAPLTTSPIDVFVDRLQRQVLREPNEEARRGETVLVVFDGADGDIGEEGVPAPRVEVQKWNPLRQAWEKERSDVRVADLGNQSGDHVGRFETDGATNLGTYRFALFARNDQHAEVRAVSKAFRLLPLEVERAWLPTALDATRDPLVKGARLVLGLQREDGDLVKDVGFFRNGERVANGTALLKSGRFEVAWTTGYALPDGAYQLIVRGKDLHNNSFASPPLRINLTGIPLLAKIPAPPAAAIQRAERLELRALVQYPDSINVKTGRFTAAFVHDGVEVGTRDLGLNRSAWLLNWTPPADAPLGEYRVRLAGEDELGNFVNGTEIFNFQLAEGVIDRTFTLQRTIANRTDHIVWTLPAQATDAAMRFVLRDDTGARREMPYNVSQNGAYVVTWNPGKDERLTRYTLEASGSDGSGNAILATSRSLLLRPAPLGIVSVSGPGRVVPADTTVTWTFQVQYADGTPVPQGEAIPQIAMVGANSRSVKPEPQLAPVEGSAGRWSATWTPLKGQHVGVFQLVATAKDVEENAVMVPVQFQSFRVDQGPLQDYLGVPGLEAALVPVVLLGAALLLRRGRD